MRINRASGIALLLAGAFALFAAVWVCAGTTGIISGTVKSSADGTPLSGANVIVTGTMLTTVTDAKGYFVITNVPPGEYEVRAEMVGFAPAAVGSVQVTMDMTSTVSFDMAQEAIVEAPAEVVRRRPMISPDAVNTLNLVSSGQEDLTRADPASLRAVPGVISTLPGVVVEPNGTGQIHLRGGRSDQVGYYMEGIPLTDPNTGFFSTNLFTTGVGRFQMYSGGFGAEYGNAISGVLNEVKKTGAQAPGMGLDTESGNQAFRTMRAQIGGEKTGGFNYYIGSVLQHNAMDGNLLIKEQEYADNVAKLVWPGKKDTFTVLALQGSLAGFLDSYHDVGNHDVPTPHEKDFMRQRYAIGAVTWSRNLGSQSFLTVRPYYIFSTTIQNVMGSYGAFQDAWSVQKGLEATYTSQLNEQHLLKTGGSIISSDNNDYLYLGFPYYQSDVDTFQTALFIEDQYKLRDKWTAEAGLRYETMKYDRTGRQYTAGSGYSGAPISDVRESALTPRLGLSYAPTENSAWKASWGKYTKFVPSSSVQTTYFDPDMVFGFGGETLEQLMPGLGSTAPQRNTAFEISYERQLSDSAMYRITPFHADYTNLGDFYTEEGITRYTNLGKGKSTGVEFFVRKKMSDNWQGWLSYTYQRTKANQADAGFVSDMFYTPWDQRHTLALVTDYRLGRWSHNLRVDLGSGRADLGDDPTVRGRANPYAVVTYGLGYQLPTGSPLGETVTLSIYNLFNTGQTLQYLSDGVTRARDSWVPSRFVSVGLSRSF